MLLENWTGVEDKLTYTSDLYQLYQTLISTKRKVVVVNGEIPMVTPDEIAQIKRSNYARQDQMIRDLSSNIRLGFNVELQRLINKRTCRCVIGSKQRLWFSYFKQID